LRDKKRKAGIESDFLFLNLHHFSIIGESNFKIFTFKEDFMGLWGMPFSTSLAFYVLAATLVLAVIWFIVTSKQDKHHE